MAANISCYILTCDSERYLESVIAPIRDVVDELVIVDSGSTDGTQQIAEQFQSRFLVQELEHFGKQRQFALDSCQHQWVLSLDSDEVPDNAFADSLATLKANDFRIGEQQPDAFRIHRRWLVLGQEIHTFYPVVSPDHPVRLFRKDRMTFPDEGRGVHESPKGAGQLEYARINGSVWHYSCDSVEELYQKLNFYTTLAAEDLRRKGKTGRWLDVLTHPPAAWFRWYLLKQGWKDGWVGWLLGHYAYEYTSQKYLKLLYDAGVQTRPREAS